MPLMLMHRPTTTTTEPPSVSALYLAILIGRLPMARWHGVGGFMFNSSSIGCRKTALLHPTCPRAFSDAPASLAMASPKTLWLSSTSLAKVDNDNYRAFVVYKAQLPHPENQSGSKRLIVESMASVGINTDVTDIAYAPAPGDTRSGFVTVHLVANITESAQLNAKKVWASHPMGRTETIALPDIGVFTIGGVYV